MAAGGVSDVTARSPVDRLNSGSGFSNCGTPDRAIGSEGVYGLPVFGDNIDNMVLLEYNNTLEHMVQEILHDV